ncbi:Homoserine dehydrogenase [Pseudomonas syringae pv. coriandricola]|nr:Homoserine dehydrogenase [Pseudomonas syringae pv. coriandricola]
MLLRLPNWQWAPNNPASSRPPHEHEAHAFRRFVRFVVVWRHAAVFHSRLRFGCFSGSSSVKPVKVGICGLGTVGGGTFNVLQRNAEEIARRAGRGIEVAQIAVRTPNPNCQIAGTPTTSDVFAVASNPEIDIVVELIGGYTLARELVLKAIENGKHVVTANKALIAVHGNEIFAKAREKGVIVAFEAAVAGGIPVIKAIREGLSANRINWVAGIINGTGNFILTEMREKGRTFPDVLAEAQALGYAEADPTFDVEGIDAAHKLTILASIAFGIPLQFDKAYTEGITKLTTADVNYAEALGYRIKHLGVARSTAQGIELRVHPTLIPADRLIANVNGVMNAVMVNGDASGSTLFYGAGAGMEPTASSVVADLVDVVRAMTSDPENRVPHLAFQPDSLSAHPILPIEACESAYYLRIQAKDHPGVLAQVASILSERGINIESIMQKEVEEHDGLVPMILLTHRVVEQRINDAIQALEALQDVVGPVVRIRVEHLN